MRSVKTGSVCITVLSDSAAFLLFNSDDLNMIFQVCELVSDCLSSFNRNSHEYLRHFLVSLSKC